MLIEDNLENMKTVTEQLSLVSSWRRLHFGPLTTFSPKIFNLGGISFDLTSNDLHYYFQRIEQTLIASQSMYVINVNKSFKIK